MKKKIFWWILIALWCIFIFTQSSKPATESDKQSLAIMVTINHFLEATLGAGAAAVTNHIVRKGAHFIEYLILGILLFNGLRVRNNLRTVVAAFIAGVIYASTDEIHQFFVPGRAMRFTDVLIDSVGLLTGILIIYLYMKRKFREY